jgi:hypothetical protein
MDDEDFIEFSHLIERITEYKHFLNVMITN